MRALPLMVAQLQPAKGAYGANVRRVGGVFAQAAAREEPPALIVLPETALTGYFLEGGVRELAVTAGTVFRDLSAQHRLAAAPPLDVVVGFYERYGTRYYNSAFYASLGGADPGVRHVHRKIFLPTYGVFDEERFVDRGHSIRAFDTAWGRVAIAICEDAWHSIVPTLAALDGAQLLIVPSASPARGVAPDPECADDRERRPASVRRWEILARQIASEHGLYAVFAQLGGFEGGKGLQGSSLVVDPHGEILVRGPLFDEALLTVTLHHEEIARARFEQPLLGDLEAQFLNLLEAPEEQAEDAGDVGDEGPSEVAEPPLATDLMVLGPTPLADTMAIDSGLTERVNQSNISATDAEQETLEFLRRHVPPGKSPMCGNSICQDRRFLYRHMKDLEKFFHYRNLDVSSLKELASRWKPEVCSGFSKNSTHLAMDDVKDSIRELQHYREHLFKLFPPPV